MYDSKTLKHDLNMSPLPHRQSLLSVNREQLFRGSVVSSSQAVRMALPLFVDSIADLHVTIHP